MKPVSKFTAALLAACASFSCTADKENAVVRHEPLPAVEYNQDLLVGDFAEALSGAIRENAAFRTLIKENVMLQFDGDYDLLLSQAADMTATLGHTEIIRTHPYSRGPISIGPLLSLSTAIIRKSPAVISPVLRNTCPPRGASPSGIRP